MVDTLDSFICDRCQSKLFFGDEECIHCHKEYTYVYWETYCNSYALAHLRKGTIIDTEEACYIALCCNQDVEKCTCSSPLDWQDANSLPTAITDEAYDYNSPCSGCQFYYTPLCLPLRAWLKEFVETGSAPGEIDLCSFYQPHESIEPPEVFDWDEYDVESDLMYFEELGGYLPVRKRA